MNKNDLITRLPVTGRQAFLDLCQPVGLVMGQVLYEAQADSLFAYFPTRGFISLVRPVDARHSIEVGMVGDEGMVGLEMVLGVTTTLVRAIVQGSGEALRIDAQRLKGALASNAALQIALQRYIYVQTAQMITAAGCVRFHLLQPRLARWLLMMGDRAHSDTFRVTQTFLATMLGVRRVGVTEAAVGLQALGLIAYHRGTMTILDRKGLKNRACGCYQQDRAVHASLLGIAPA